MFIFLKAHIYDEDYESTEIKDYNIVGIIQDISEKNNKTSYVISVTNSSEKYPINNKKIIAYNSSDGSIIPGLEIGNVISIKGTFSTASTPENTGEYNEKSYYDSMGYRGKIFADNIEIVSRKKNVFRSLIYHMRKRISANVINAMGEEDGGILCAIIFGEKSHLDENIKELYRRAGIAHILAISGLHVSILGLALFEFLRKKVMPMRCAVVTASVLLIIYCIFTGGGPATMRAVIMLVVNMFARFFFRSYDRPNAIALSAIIILINNPYQLFQCGFILSFTSIIGIGISREVIEDISGENKAVKAVLPSLIFFVITLPVISYFYYEISPLTILLNTIVLPFMVLIIAIGLFGSLVSFANMAIAEFVLSSVRTIFGYYKRVCMFVDKFPGGKVVTGREGVAFIVLFYIIFVLTMLYVRFYKDRRGLVMGMCILAVIVLCFRGQEDFSYHQLSIGQGDCACIFYGNKTIMIDGGSTTKKEIGKRTISGFLKYHGRDSLDAVFVTHSDEDHISGIVELIENESLLGIHIEKIIIADIHKKDPALQTFEANATKHGIKVLRYKKGDCYECGNFKMRCLHPYKDYDWESANDYSLTFGIEVKNFRMLTSGDLEESGEEVVDTLGEYLVYKCGHHGSKSSSSDGFIDRINPKYAIISAGKNNKYGHPAKETLEKLKVRNVEILNTIEDGEISVNYDLKNEKLDFYTMKPHKNGDPKETKNVY